MPGPGDTRTAQRWHQPGQSQLLTHVQGGQSIEGLPDMATPCKTCHSEHRDEIEGALLAGQSISAVARKYGMNRDSLGRHRAVHMSGALAAVTAARESQVQDSAIRLLDRVTALINDAQSILATAKADGKPSIALAAIREARGLLETYGKVTGELKPDGAVTVQVLNVATNPEWLAIKQALMRTFDRLPDPTLARVAFAEEMRAIDGYEEPTPKLLGARAIAPYRAPAEDVEEGDFEEQDDA